MFLITFENEINRQWSYDVVFPEYKDAEDFLITKGYIKSNYVFKRESNGWYLSTKAYISRLKVYSK